ncbi:MAG: DUF2971 domain-containing protein [Bacteroides sp.]|nr:DUF2971 domain-containing protein [Bacteroides sp.]
MRGQQNFMLHHYTSAYGLEGILKKDHINLRATRFSHLNDSKEYNWISEKIKDKKKDICKSLEIPFDPDQHTYPYVICFAELADNHLMWKLYGTDGKGYMLTFDYSKLEEFVIEHYKDGDHLQSITYTDETDWELKFFQTLNVFNQIETICHSTDIDKVCAFIKRRIYAHENETRYLRCVHDAMAFSYNGGNHKEVYDGENYEKFEFRVSDYGIIPYIDINLPKDILKSITIGYGYNFQSQRDAINLMLQSRGYTNVELLQSKIIP